MAANSSHIFPHSHIMKYPFCDYFQINIESKSAVGVRFLQNGKEQIVSANKEVIVCCGAVGTPKVSTNRLVTSK